MFGHFPTAEQHLQPDEHNGGKLKVILSILRYSDKK